MQSNSRIDIVGDVMMHTFFQGNGIPIKGEPNQVCMYIYSKDLMIIIGMSGPSSLASIDMIATTYN